MTTITSRYFNQHTSKVQKAAERAPVIITRRGEPSHVLMSIADFRRLAGEVVPDAAKKARNTYEYLTHPIPPRPIPNWKYRRAPRAPAACWNTS